MDNRINLKKVFPDDSLGRRITDIKAPSFKPISPQPQIIKKESEPIIEEFKSTPVLPPKPNKNSKLKFVTFGLLILLLLAGGSAYYFYQKTKISSDPNTAAQDKLNTTIAEIGKLTILPEVDNNSATLSVVLDPEQAKADPNPSFKFFNFFENAQAGDYLLHYPNLGKSVLYRPSTHQIINILNIPLSILNSQTSSTTNTNTSTTSTSTKVK